MQNIYHVAKNGNDKNCGSKEAPFATINAAAAAARAGDTVLVHEGVYREWVNPQYGGLSNTRRITYAAAENEKVVIKGSERVQNWENCEGTIWRAVLPNTLFGAFNPFAELIIGDWQVWPAEKRHLGDVYLNGMSFYEANHYDELKTPAVRTEVMDHWTETIVPVVNVPQTKYLWFAEVGDDTTTVYANFHASNPNRELVEVNVRKCCFYPRATGVNYITVRGFEMAQAATPWAPPTADQPGLLGAHWSKGWIIENNRIHDAKCSAISIGKEASTGNNYRTFRKDKPGYQYQLESVFTAAKSGWSKERIGSHIVRGNTIYDCGQNGIVGHLGCVFSEIYNNHIYNIAIKREFYGHEIAGIKLHAAIDVHIHNNCIHHCSLGMWMDWQAQGTRISKNVVFANSRDLFMEVSHGPFVIDNNLFGSVFSLDNHAQGGAYVNNLFMGKMVVRKMLNRATPYHAPHSTDVTGYAMVYGGDDRFYGNIFVGGEGKTDVGTAAFNGYTKGLKEYMAEVDRLIPGDLEIFEKVEQPVYIEGNVYLNGASGWQREDGAVLLGNFNPKVAFEMREGAVYLHCELPELPGETRRKSYSTYNLPRVRIVDADFENPDGSPLELDTDFMGNTPCATDMPGPIASLQAGQNCIKVWG